MAKKKRRRKIWKREEILKLKTSNEVLQALDDNPWRAETNICLYKRELALKERKEKFGYENPLQYWLDKKSEKKK